MTDDPLPQQRLRHAFAEHLRVGKHLPRPVAFYLAALWQAVPALSRSDDVVIASCVFAMGFAAGGLLVRRYRVRVLLGAAGALGARYALHVVLEGTWRGWLGYALFAAVFLLALPLELHRRRRFPGEPVAR